MKALLHSSKETFLGKKIDKHNLFKTCCIALLIVLYYCNVKQQDSQCHSVAHRCVLMWSSAGLKVTEAAQLILRRFPSLFASVFS